MAINSGGAYSELYKSGSNSPLKNKKLKPKSEMKPKTKTYDKSSWDTKTKVSQGTIDNIKSMGMTSALKMVKDYSNSNVKANPGNREFLEGVRRLYGDQRFNAAGGSSSKTASSSSKTSPRNAEMAGKAEASRKPLPKKVQNKLVPAKKKSISNSGKAQALAGAALAVGALALSRGKATGLAAKLSPTVAKGIKKVGGAATPAYLKPVGPRLNSLQAKAMTKAKAGKALTPGQYAALKAAAAKSNKGDGLKKVAKKAVVKPKLTKGKTLTAGGASTVAAPNKKKK